MPLLDIEKVVQQDDLKSRFKLVYVAGLRARELNNPKEDTVRRQNSDHSKVTTTALDEIIRNQVSFDRIADEDEQGSDQIDE